MTTDLNETRLQVFFLPVNIYVEDAVVVSIFKTIIWLSDCKRAWWYTPTLNWDPDTLLVEPVG